MSKAPHLDGFLAAANYFKGMCEDPLGSNYFTDPKADEMFGLLYANQVEGAGPGQAWCAMFVSACAAKVDIDWNVIYPGTGVGAVTSNTVDYCGGEWIPGPYFTGGGVTPAPGDLISFVGDPASEYSGYLHGGHIGIVISVDDNNYVHTIEGNVSDCCAECTHYYADDNINGYVRPDWSIVGDDVSDYVYNADGGKGGKGSKGGGKGGTVVTTYTPLYTSKNDRHDMTLREVCYMNSSYQLTNSPSGINISIMNYTTLLSQLYEYMGMGYSTTVVGGGRSGYSDSTNTDTSGLAEFDENVKVSVDYFLQSGFSASASCGIAGALYSYSLLNPVYSEEMASGVVLWGIAAWETEEFQELRDRAGYEDKYTLSAQLDFLVYELETKYEELVEDIKYSEDGSVNAEYVAKEVIWHYNNHFRHSDYEKAAKKNAKDFYDALVFTTTNAYGGGKDLRDIDGNELTPQFVVDVPEDVPQAGIDGNFTSYSYWYCDSPDAWAAGTIQRRIADQWAYEGFPYDRGSIAVVGGYYCFGMAEDTFGETGDIVVVELENGDSFAGILADVKFKGDANYCKWGHYYTEGWREGLVNMVEWERIATYDGEIALGDMTSSAGVDDIYLGSWEGQNIVRVTNYGSYGL